VWVPAGFLAAILSGTRGIWAASIGVIALVPLWAFVMRRMHTDIIRRRLFVYAASYLALFFVLFSLAWPIFVSPQFLVGKGDANLLAHRLRSVIDFGETSNALRIEIWKASWHSIRNHPLLGVGIGNFPVVLGQDISLARAGSTAHNLYIHVASEMGLPAAVVATLILMGTVLSAFRWFSRAHGSSLIYAASLLLYLPWVYAYVMTDPILFDERVFLLWASTIALVFAHDHA
jgi:putative inorganic carbon (HCO3(-)) transporter